MSRALHKVFPISKIAHLFVGAFVVLLVAGCPQNNDNNVGSPPWAKTYGGTGYEDLRSIQQTSDGGYIVSGETNSFGADAFWIFKLNYNGKVIWQKTYGGAVFESASAIQPLPDGGYIMVGSTASFGAGETDAWVLKLNSDGIVVWQKTYGGTVIDSASAIQPTSDGGYILAGSTQSFGGGNSYAWVLKLDGDGTVEWQKAYGGTNFDSAYDIHPTLDGGYIVLGNIAVGGESIHVRVLKLNSDGTVAWQKTYGGADYETSSAIWPTSDGGYIIAADSASVVTGIPYHFHHVWILKLESDGTVAWQKTYGSTDIHIPSAIQPTPDGGYIVAAFTVSFGAGSMDFWVLKLNSDGTVAWQKAYGGTDWEQAMAIKLTSDGGYIIAGQTISFGAGSGDVWVLKLNGNGTIPFNSASGAETTDTDVTPVDTNVIPVDTTATIIDTNATVSDSAATVTDTDAIIQQQAP